MTSNLAKDPDKRGHKSWRWATILSTGPYWSPREGYTPPLHQAYPLRSPGHIFLFLLLTPVRFLSFPYYFHCLFAPSCNQGRDRNLWNSKILFSPMSCLCILNSWPNRTWESEKIYIHTHRIFKRWAVDGVSCPPLDLIPDIYFFLFLIIDKIWPLRGQILSFCFLGCFFSKRELQEAHKFWIQNGTLPSVLFLCWTQMCFRRTQMCLCRILQGPGPT